MAKLYYGDGKCSIQGKVRGVHIKYTGNIEIEDKTSNSFVIVHQNNGIMIFPIGRGTLGELFEYIGKFKITSAQAANIEGEKEPITIHKVMDYSELLTSNSEDMTTKSEDLRATGDKHGKIVSKTSLNQPNLNNLNTSTNNLELYYKDGTQYSGYFHIHLSDNLAMTGKEHTGDSKELYYMSIGRLIPTKNKSLIPPATIERDLKSIKKGSKKSFNKTQRTSNGSSY